MTTLLLKIRSFLTAKDSVKGDLATLSMLWFYLGIYCLVISFMFLNGITIKASGSTFIIAMLGAGFGFGAAYRNLRRYLKARREDKS